jgi:uncharacterized protein YqjF (DUF2071 family)
VTPVSPEPVTADAPKAIPRPWLTQSWFDLTFIHWAVEPRQVAPLLPRGAVPDTLDGITYVGLIAFRMHRVGWFGLPGMPYLGSFPEINVRLYSVDEHGRRGVVFRSLDAARLLPVIVGRVAFGLPYEWSRMAIHGKGDLVRYTSSRRWPGPRGAYSRITVRIGETVGEATELEHFLTARWGLHNAFLGRTGYVPNDHPRWPLHRATLLQCDQDLVGTAGLPVPLGEPVSVLYSPGVPVRFGMAARPAGIATP